MGHGLTSGKQTCQVKGMAFSLQSNRLPRWTLDLPDAEGACRALPGAWKKLLFCLPGAIYGQPVQPIQLFSRFQGLTQLLWHLVSAPFWLVPCGFKGTLKGNRHFGVETTRPSHAGTHRRRSMRRRGQCPTMRASSGKEGPLLQFLRETKWIPMACLASWDAVVNKSARLFMPMKSILVGIAPSHHSKPRSTSSPASPRRHHGLANHRRLVTRCKLVGPPCFPTNFAGIPSRCQPRISLPKHHDLSIRRHLLPYLAHDT